MPPARAPANAIDRSRWTTGRAGRARRGTGASIRWRTSAASSDDRAAVAAAAQAEGDRRDGEQRRARPARARARRRAATRVAGSSVTRSLSHMHDDAADEGREVHAVGDLEPLQVAESADPPGPPQIPNDDDMRLAHATGATLIRRRRSPPTAAGPRRPSILCAVDVEAVQVFIVAAGPRRRRRGAVALVVGRARWPAVGARRRGSSRRRRRRAVDRLPRRRARDGRQPLLLRGRRLRAVPAVLVPAHRDVPAGRDPARRGDPARPRRALVRRPARRHRRRASRSTTTSSSGTRRWRVATCGVGPSCSDIWFREFGFVTLAFMALCGFVAILVLVVPRPPPVTTQEALVSQTRVPHPARHRRRAWRVVAVVGRIVRRRRSTQRRRRRRRRGDA